MLKKGLNSVWINKLCRRGCQRSWQRGTRDHEYSSKCDSRPFAIPIDLSSHTYQNRQYRKNIVLQATWKMQTHHKYVKQATLRKKHTHSPQTYSIRHTLEVHSTTFVQTCHLLPVVFAKLFKRHRGYSMCIISQILVHAVNTSME